MASYFMPSFFQKRLLKYVLSRVGLVETDALDLDNLGISWGQRCVVELKDIGLKLDKLSTLLSLPASCELLNARVRNLRITLPADIHSSGIACEADGIDVHTRLLPEESKTENGKTGKQKWEHMESSTVPTPSGLAESFLESEPREEREELQAAISSQSGVLPADPLAWNAEDDNELGLGSESLSLPSFVAGFIKGVIDRFQLQLKNVVIRVDMELKQDGPSKRLPGDKLDLVTALLTIGKVEVHGVSGVTAGSGEDLPLREGKRLISIIDTNIALISDLRVFSNYSRFAAPASPTMTMRSRGSQPSSRAPSSRAPSSRAPSPSPLDPPNHPEYPEQLDQSGYSEHSSHSDRSEHSNLSQNSDQDPLAMTQSTILERPQPLGHSSTTGLQQSAFSQDGRFSDADSEYGGSHEYPEDSQDFENDPFQDDQGYLDSVIETDLYDFDQHSPVIHPQEAHLTQNGQANFQSSDPDSSNQSHAEYPQESSFPPSLHSFEFQHHFESEVGENTQHASHADDFDENENNERLQSSVSSHSNPALSEPESTGPKATSHSELTESRYFSHDEAQSLYMSAVSEAASASFMPNMPGAWNSSDGPSKAEGFFGNQPSREGSFQDRGEEIPDCIVTGDENLAEQPVLDVQAQSKTLPKDQPSTPSSSGLHGVDEIRKPVLNIAKVLFWISPPASGDGDTRHEPTPASEKTNFDLKESTVDFGNSTYEGGLMDSRAYASTKFGRANVDPRTEANTDSKSFGIAVEVFSASVHFDISTGWLLTKIAKRVSQAFDTAEKDLSTKDSPSNKPERHPSVHLVVHETSVNFVERVVGHAHSPQHTGSPMSPYNMEDVILRLAISGLDARLSSQDSATKLNLDIANFTFGFASEDLISFNKNLKMRESTRDLRYISKGDISITVIKTLNWAKADISTLPLHVNFNIQRLEEVLGWMGGLSTILELGSSISSVSTVKGSPALSKKHPRGVRFETPTTVAETKDHSTPWKVNARVGTIVLDVIGENHCLQLSTTAVKVVSRLEGIGIQVDKAKLIGPLLLDSDSLDAPAKIILSDIRLEFLSTPKGVDLERLLMLITPSKDKYEDDDDIMLDTLLRQRRQGSVLRVTVGGVDTLISDIGGLEPLSPLGVELGRLSNVTKYLPEDDRPGILILLSVHNLEGHIHVGGQVGDIEGHLADVEVAHITMPSLTAAQIKTISVNRNGNENLVGHALSPPSNRQDLDGSIPPAFMARFIPDEMEPTYKIKLHSLLVEYTVPSVSAFLGLGIDTTTAGVASNMANSIANLAESSLASPPSLGSSGKLASSGSLKPINLAVVFRDCVLGLNPRNSLAKGLTVLSHAKFAGSLHGEGSAEASLDIKKASLMVIDDVRHEGSDNLHQRDSAVDQSSQVQAYIGQGYVPVSFISSAIAGVKLTTVAEDGTKSLDVELKDDLLVLETCADSTQTLISIMNGLQPPTPPSVNVKYRTEVMPLQDMFASFTGNAFEANPTLSHDYDLSDDLSTIAEESSVGDQLTDELEYVSDFTPGRDGMGGTNAEGSNDLLDSFHSHYQVSSSLTELDFQEDHFAKKSAVGGTAHRWDSTQNTYGLANDTKLQRSPLRVRVRDVHFIWNLFDGYDWQRTRDTISKAVKDVEAKATERRARGSRASLPAEDDDESVIGDFLFNSIYIGIPANKDPHELHRDINHDIDDLTSETGSYATSTTVTGAGSRQGRPSSKREKTLRLHRSKQRKMTFELRGVSADLVLFPPGSEETQSSLDVRVNDLEIYDHVPTSTWKKFATYMHEAGEKESGTSMVHLEVLTVKPVPELAASEIVLKATVLPIRLHVDQDALDFMSRFFEFRDQSAEPSAAPGDIPFLQRVEVNAIQVKLDFKPKRVDYAGLRSGRTTEFMNFFVLDGAAMVLRHVIIYGVSGFDRLGQTLNDIWMPDVKKNQLPGVLAGLAPIRSLVNVGGGVRDLVVVPMREYKKDGRIVRSIQKGAVAFAKTTSNELVKLGAKLAIGTQTVLQGAEDLLTTPAPDGDDDDEEEKAKKVSLYAHQPVGVVQGLRGAYSGLERDLLLARDAIVAVPGEVVESGSATAAAKAVWKRAPTVILRPAIGVSKAVGQTLLGAGNTLDPGNRRKMEDKYKRY